MAKAEPLTMDALATAQITPKAATPARGPSQQERAKAEKPKEEKEPLQIRVPKTEARAIKVAAAERGQSHSDFMLACFHAYMQRGKA